MRLRGRTMHLRSMTIAVHVAALAAGIGASGAGCGGSVDERDQWTVWITTDAPVPTFVDRALVEVLNDDGNLACDDCRRLLGLPVDAASWPISFGVAVPPSGIAPRVRVRLYRAARVAADGMPPIATTIDRVAKLPAARGNTHVTFLLPMDCVGVVADVTSRTSCADASRELVDERVLPTGMPPAEMAPGTWSRAVRRPCELPVEEDMVCVPGGFFVLGDSVAGNVGAMESAPERLVTVAPFALDREEMKVGTVRDLVRRGVLDEEPIMRSSERSSIASFCTWIGKSSKENDDLPLNCVDHAFAAKVCTALGKRLPTEAEWEWAAGNLEEETLRPWGHDGDPCTYADVGLADSLGVFPGSSLCRSLPGKETVPAGLPAQPNPRDRTALGLMAMGGGLGEWVADRAAPYDAPCWRPEEPFLEDPRCDEGENFVIRGLSWGDAPGLLRVPGRQSAPSSTWLPSIGFRCARSE